MENSNASFQTRELRSAALPSPSTKTYSTEVAAKRIGVSFRTLNRWLAQGKIRPSQGIPFSDGRKLWRWSDADLAKGRKIKATLKPGRRARKK